jgi:hypothetical protein
MSTTEERYARAINSSHLEVKEEARGDADTLIAAGMAETLGVMLARLRAEWDAQSGEAQQYPRAAKRFNAKGESSQPVECLTLPPLGWSGGDRLE